jgi:alkylated DNA repair dioxygenase AlkB
MTTLDPAPFTRHELGEGLLFLTGVLPAGLIWDPSQFDEVWNLHPADKHLIQMHGLLLNWYDGPGHYIGPHHDSTRDMVPGTPIITISFGETRVFRLTRGKGDKKEDRDFPAEHGAVFVMPFDTNLAWKHSVPKSARYRDRRISVTLRAFNSDEVDVAVTGDAPPGVR